MNDKKTKVDQSKRQGLKRKQKSEPILEDRCSAIKYNEETYENQLTSDIKVEPEQFESSLENQSDSEIPPHSRIKPGDESHHFVHQESQIKQETDFGIPSSDVDILEPSKIKQEIEFNELVQQVEMNQETDCIPQSDLEILEPSKIKQEIEFNELVQQVEMNQETEPSDLEIPEPSNIKQEIEFNELVQQVEMNQETDLISQRDHEIPEPSEVKQEAESCNLLQQETYPDFIAPETIFLQEFVTKQEPQDDKTQTSSVTSLSQSSTGEENSSNAVSRYKCKSHLTSGHVENSGDEFCKCKYCNLYVGTKNSLYSHLVKKHSGSNSVSPLFQQFYDHLCRYHVKSVDNFDTMLTYSLLMEVVDADSSLPCLECGTTEKNLSSHFNSKHPRCRNTDFIQCKICLKCHNDIKKMESHLRSRHKNHYLHWVCERTVYRCKKCEQLFDKFCIMGLVGGLRLKEIDIFRIYSNGFDFKYILFKPLTVVPQYYCCAICKPNTFFALSVQLWIHLNTHEDVEFKKLSGCTPNYIPNVQNLYYHAKQNCCNFHAMDFEHYKSNGIGSECATCSIHFANTCSLAIHIQSVHLGNKFNYVTVIDGKCTCPVCNVIFSDQKLFYAHCSPYTILFPSTFCEQCSILFSIPFEFEEHCIEQHGNPDCFKCKICNVGKKSKLQLENHVAKEHNVQLIHCTRCLSNVKIKDQLTIKHFKNCYRNCILSSCPICGLIMESFQMLIEHIILDMLVLAKKTHQCKYCLNYFYSKYNLCAHMVNGKCKDCNLYFCGKKKLAEH